MGCRLVALLLLPVAVALGGCVGSTEPATEVGTDSARLNARGTANNGPASSYFEYQPTNGAGFLRQTEVRRWPAGVSGSFSERVDLLPATPYEFRVCGRDDADAGPYACAQTRTFRTSNPSGDRVKATYYNQLRPGTPTYVVYKIDARSGPAGENPSGFVDFGPIDGFKGFVNCLAVRGGRAAVGAIGQSDSGDDGYESVLLTLPNSDGGTGEIRDEDSGDAGLSCHSAVFGPARVYDTHEVVIYDAP